MLKLLIIALLIGGAGWYLTRDGEVVTHPPAMLITQEPAQGVVKGKSSWQHEGYQITPLASFSLGARILHKSQYRLGREADISPYDLALGWREMSDSAVLDQLTITQSNRWYFYKWRGNPPASPGVMARSSANMHMIPANDEVRKVLDQVVEGNVIALQGYLVRVNADDGWRWKSSTSRTDVGKGACEVVWVEKIAIVK